MVCLELPTPPARARGQPRWAPATLPGGAGPTLVKGQWGPASPPTSPTWGTFGSVPPVSTAYRGIAYRVTWCPQWPKIHWTVTTAHHDNGSEFVCHPFSHGRTSRGSAGTRDCRLHRALLRHDTSGSPGGDYKTEPAGAAGDGGGGTSQGRTSPFAAPRGERGHRGRPLLEPGIPVRRCPFPGCPHGPGRGSPPHPLGPALWSCPREEPAP